MNERTDGWTSIPRAKFNTSAQCAITFSEYFWTFLTIVLHFLKNKWIKILPTWSLHTEYSDINSHSSLIMFSVMLCLFESDSEYSNPLSANHYTHIFPLWMKDLNPGHNYPEALRVCSAYWQQAHLTWQGTSPHTEPTLLPQLHLSAFVFNWDIATHPTSPTQPHPPIFQQWNAWTNLCSCRIKWKHMLLGGGH